MLRHFIAALVAILAAFLAVVAYYFIWIVIWHWEGPRLIATLILLGLSICLFRRSRGIPTFLLVVGSIALAVAHLHDYLIELGIEHDLFQLGGSDSYIMQGFFEPRENPLIAVPADVMRYTGVVAIIGFAWLVARVAHTHLTKRSSEPLTGV